MFILAILSGVAIIIILVFIVIENFSSKLYVKIISVGVILLAIMIFSAYVEIDAKNKITTTERVIITDYLETSYNTTLIFDKPTKIKIIEYKTPAYSLTTIDRFEYKILE